MKRSSYRLIQAVAFAAAISAASGQQIATSMVWERLYEDSACDLYRVIEIDGGYVMGGRIYDGDNGIWGDDCILLKIDSEGEIQWERTYGGSGREAVGSLQQTSDGGYIFAATSTSPPSGSKESSHFGAEDAWVVKLDATGNKQWEKSFGTSGEDAAYSIRHGTDGGYLLAGRSGGNYWSMKISAEGEKEWELPLGEGASGAANEIVDTVDGGYALVGSSHLSPGPYGGFDGWLMKVNAQGVTQWQSYYGGSGDENFGASDLTLDGGFILGGFSSSPPSGNKESPLLGGWDYWLVKVDAAGKKEWDRSYGTASEFSVESVRVIRQTTDQGYVFGGYAGGRSRLVRVDARGVLEWEQYLGTPGPTTAVSHVVEIDELQRTKDGGYILAGSYDYPTRLPRPFGCVWGAWAAKFETILSLTGEVVTWPADAGVVLESVDELNGEWEADQSEVRRIGDANTIAFTPSGESRYYRLRGTGSATDVLSFGTLLSWPGSINHVLEFSSNNGAQWTAFTGEQGAIGATNYAIIPQSMKEHDFRTRKVN